MNSYFCPPSLGLGKLSFGLPIIDGINHVVVELFRKFEEIEMARFVHGDHPHSGFFSASTSYSAQPFAIIAEGSLRPQYSSTGTCTSPSFFTRSSHAVFRSPEFYFGASLADTAVRKLAEALANPISLAPRS
jgi:hypothetical protein